MLIPTTYDPTLDSETYTSAQNGHRVCSEHLQIDTSTTKPVTFPSLCPGPGHLSWRRHPPAAQTRPPGVPSSCLRSFYHTPVQQILPALPAAFPAPDHVSLPTSPPAGLSRTSLAEHYHAVLTGHPAVAPAILQSVPTSAAVSCPIGTSASPGTGQASLLPSYW